MSSTTEALTPAKPARSVRKIIVRSVLAIVVLGGGLTVWRLTSLRGLPNIPPPFDRERDGVIDLRPEDNAFTYYVRAHERYRDTQPTSMLASYTDWLQVDQAQLKFVDDNREALDIWLEGTKRDRGFYHQPKTLTFMTMLPAVQSLRNFCRAANLVGFRYEHEGDYAKAWEWYRANLRASRHSGQHGVAIERLVGVAIYASTSPNVRRWAENPKVTTAQVKQALQEVLEIEALTGSPRNLICAEYFSCMNSLEDATIRTQVLDGSYLDGSGQQPSFKSKVKVRAIAAYGALRREPERSKRVIQLVVSNWLTVADLPAPECLKLLKMHKDLPLFDTLEATSLMPLDELASWFDTTIFARMYMPGWGNIDRALVRDEQTRAALIVHLAEQVYTREKGKPPATPQDLVGSYLQALPAGFDPNDATIPTTVKPAGR